MKLFTCPVCQQTLHFENFSCTKCHHMLAYLPDRAVLTALEPVSGSDDGLFDALGAAAKRSRYRLCGNQLDHGVCNWAVPEEEAPDQRFCLACRLNDIIPDLSDPKTLAFWARLEAAKRRTIYTLLLLGLPIETRAAAPENGLAFAFKQDLPGEEKVFTAHDHGLITINVAEADSPFREKTRVELGESYRTLLGHFRHEIGHYYWDRLVADSPRLEPFRKLFGDEQISYEEAKEAHYKSGATADWQQSFVSSYASMHPWEDWAESWAHYLHMVDTLETAQSFGLALQPQTSGSDAKKLKVGTRRLHFDDFDELVRVWVPLTMVLNSLNRSMGLPDPYPFVLAAPALQKIRFVHEVVEAGSAAAEKAA